MSPWTTFEDQHSGGSNLKMEPYEYIFIQAPKNIAMVYFQNRFGIDPENITCTCCDDDYDITEYPTLEEATKFLSISLEELRKEPYALIIPLVEIDTIKFVTRCRHCDEYRPFVHLDDGLCFQCLKKEYHRLKEGNRGLIYPPMYPRFPTMEETVFNEEEFGGVSPDGSQIQCQRGCWHPSVPLKRKPKSPSFHSVSSPKSPIHLLANELKKGSG